MMRFALDHAEIVLPELAMLAMLAILYAVPATRGLAHRAIRTGKACARDRSLPMWARYGFILASLPVPGPFDEIVGALIVAALWRTGHGRTVRAHWHASAVATLA